MKKSFLFAAAAAALLFSSMTSAYAAEDGSGWYAGAKVGVGHIGASNGDVGSKIDKNDWAAGALVGYKFDKTWAVEGSWDYLGKYDIRGGDVRTDSLSVAGIGKYPLCEKSYVFGKLGVSTGYTKANGPGAPADSGRALGAVFGGGVGYQIDKHYEVRGEWTRYDNVGVRNGDVGQGHVDLLNVSGIYNF